VVGLHGFIYQRFYCCPLKAGSGVGTLLVGQQRRNLRGREVVVLAAQMLSVAQHGGFKARKAKVVGTGQFGFGKR
jgi:hypothetical protein